MSANDHAHEHEVHITPYKVYIGVWAALIVLTGVTVGAALVDMKQMTIFVALFIACAKSLLVILYFMHIAYESRVFWWFLISAFGAYIVFVVLTFADYAFR
ncbi:MAG: cytochrome C oxidase subunit IV family protein [Planctomycetota bacterium]|nr:cytochrome C oxidase subunit IV family protein [Planctomycetota bacterium]